MCGSCNMWVRVCVGFLIVGVRCVGFLRCGLCMCGF